MILRVAHADIAMHMAFSRSVAHWQGVHEGFRWKQFSGDCGPLLIGKRDGIVIDGNCTNCVSAPDGGLVHVYGNLNSAVEVGGHYEIVIMGDVGPDAVISASGFCDIFVGGRFGGTLRSTGSARIWIETDLDGSIKTGEPSTELYVGRDYIGDISPKDEGSLLWLTVAGFARHASILKIAGCDYTQFNASIAKSDVPPGLYPENGQSRRRGSGHSFNRWCVATQGGNGHGK
jgi:hypothetical protein